ncbi:4'-phosphopantetheinyl transferase family protein [Actinopolyspora mortivallis]|uniref:4'-phosphopantetheinyl transferase n=1 Tax=Actinopolyspora mortivallis TaxID=33906 RepID=A0A2T0H1K0_ACTMO|nr:4'-phosphopantetheinyl transferase superfamily protein [Actinopolyspora mortivallis]PRW65249.1 4'-phosphopantetheinyl transferase [Actinopolyspora mortivallis]
MIERILPEEVVSSETFGDDPRARLLPQEERFVARAVHSRRREFTVARHCARRALARLGYDEVPVPQGESRQPVWPAGVVGSITHCTGYCAAAVTSSADVLTVGIDAESDAPLPTGVLDQVSTEEERRLLEQLPDGDNWDRLLFSAKESVYKAWFPLTGRWLGFTDAFVRFERGGRFRAELTVPPVELPAGTLTGFTGHFVTSAGLMATSVVVRPGDLRGRNRPNGKEPTRP